MKKRITIVSISVWLLTAIIGCGNANEAPAPKSFCGDTTCVSEPMKFESAAEGKPFVYITFLDCKFDTIHWEKGGMGVIKDIVFSEFIPNEVKPSRSLISCDIIAAKHAWIKFNDCKTGRGYALKLPFDKTGVTSKYTSAINSFDPQFKVAERLIAYYDNTFIYVQDMVTDQIAKTLLTDTGVKDIDFNDVHSLIKTVTITKEKIMATIVADGKTIDINKPLAFK